MAATEIRDALKPWNKQRINVTGVLDGFGKWERRTTKKHVPNRQTLRACITSPEVNGKVIGHHVWVVDCSEWEQHFLHEGKRVKFDAVVEEYRDGHNQTNYCLARPGELILIAPSMSIPEPRPERNGKPKLNEIIALDKPPQPPSPAPPAEPLALAAAPTVVVAPQPAIVAAPPVVATAPPPPATVAVASDQIAMMKLAKRFVKACGRADRAAQVIEFLRENPVSDFAQLAAWVGALTSEDD